jgi:hypothetical protein
VNNERPRRASATKEVINNCFKCGAKGFEVVILAYDRKFRRDVPKARGHIRKQFFSPPSPWSVALPESWTGCASPPK